MCFCTKSRRSSDKVLEQCFYFKLTQITSSDKSEIKEGRGRRREGSRLFQQTLKAGWSSSSASSLCVKLMVKQGSCPCKGITQNPGFLERFQQLMFWCFFMPVWWRNLSSPYCTKFTWMYWPLSPGLQNGCHLWTSSVQTVRIPSYVFEVHDPFFLFMVPALLLPQFTEHPGRENPCELSYRSIRLPRLPPPQQTNQTKPTHSTPSHSQPSASPCPF